MIELWLESCAVSNEDWRATILPDGGHPEICWLRWKPIDLTIKQASHIISNFDFY